jgi:hypothetical protein
MRLVRKSDNTEVKVGDTVTTFRGEIATLTDMQPPKHSGSTGRVYVKFPQYDNPQSYYPSVIDCHFVA